MIPKEGLHRQIFEKNRAIQLLIDPETARILEGNPAACAFYGYSPSELARLKITDLNTLPLEAVGHALGEAASGKREFFRFRHRLASGEERDVEVHAAPVEIDGRPLVYSIIHDVTAIRRAEESALSLLRSTLESTADGILVIDSARRIVSFNERFQQLWRIPPEVVRGGDDEGALAFVVDQLSDPAGFRTRVEQLYSEPLSDGFDIIHFKDGRVFERYSMPQELDGVPVGRVWSFRDVTDRTRAEAGLRESEENFRLLFANNPQAMWVHDAETLAFLEVNDAAVERYGYSREEFLGLGLSGLVEAGTGQLRSLPHQQVHRSKSGERIEVEVSSHALSFTARGAVLVVAQDVTQRRRAEEALQQAHQFTTRIISSAGEGIIVYDRDLRCVVWNSFMEGLTGLASSDALSRLPEGLPSCLDATRLLKAALLGQTQTSGDVPFSFDAGGRCGWLSGSYSPLRNAQGEIVGVIAIVQDITERKRAEALQAALYRIAETTSGAKDMGAFYKDIHGIVGELMYAKNFYIALYDQASDFMTFPYFVDEVDPPPPPRKLGKILTGYVLRQGRPMLCSPAVFDELVRQGEVELAGGASVDWLGVPLMRGDKAFGVLVVQSYSESVRFSSRDLDLLTFVSQHVAAAIDRKQAADALLESEAKFRTLADTTSCGIFIQQGAKLRYANPAGLALSGYSLEELQNLNLWDLVHPDHRETALARGLARHRGEDVPARYEMKIVCRDGAVRWLDLTAGVIEFGGQPATLGTAFDISERKSAEEQIKNLAYHDALTGLPNRRLFNDRLAMAVAQAHRLGQRLAVLFLDLDRFKVINDSLGHAIGDQLLKAVSERLIATVREGDTVARLGGDEFTLLLPGAGRPLDLAKLAEKILEHLRQPFRLEKQELFVTCSMGISLYPEDGRTGEALVKNADTAMYRAKDQGRDNYQLYTPAMNATALERLGMENSLRKALSAGELELHYQPILDLKTGEVCSVEALVRWSHPERGLIGPTEFIPLAEVTGLILPMGRWILRTACAQVREWHLRGHQGLTLSVNLSARQFQQPDIAQQISSILEETGLPPGCLDLEITESNAMQSTESAGQALRALKALGVRVSIDDFGVGYSSLSYLKRLPIDTLKIDRSFVQDIVGDPDHAAIITAMIAMAHTLKLVVVAEGVEAEEQLAFLSKDGCDRMQGFLFSRALPPQDCEKLLRRHQRKASSPA